ncbi:MAG TPA: flavoprotein [Lachnospiraceae bacterium]|nr:flavoprotein [Lachnospiraceae bacterium]
MRLIIHDLLREQAELFIPPQDEETKIIYEKGRIHPCTGCFGCWLQTPGTCVMKDGYHKMGKELSRCDELMIVSRCVYGGFSPFVKNVLDRSIGYVLPEFEIRNGEMHHALRYSNTIRMRVLFYGSDIAEWEKETARRIVEANAENLGCTVEEVVFEMQDLGGLPC